MNNKKELIRDLKRLTRESVLEDLTEWQASQKDLDAQLDRLYDLMGAAGESPFLDAIYGIAIAHTKAVARLVGDDTGALEWWKYECGFGENPLSAGKGNKMRPIKTLKQLAALIAE